MSFVLDASVALLWLAPETNPAGNKYAADVLTALRQQHAVVPSLFALEVANVVSRLESKGAVTEADSRRYIALLERLNIVVDTKTASVALAETLNLARRYKLSAYDASYLELALRLGLSLATLDSDLSNAATRTGVRVVNVS